MADQTIHLIYPDGLDDPTLNLYSWPDYSLIVADLGLTVAGSGIQAWKVTRTGVTTSGIVIAQLYDDFGGGPVLMPSSPYCCRLENVTGDYALGYAATTLQVLQLAEQYQAKIYFVRDEVNTKDEYTIAWYRNGKPVAASAGSSSFQVTKYNNSSLISAYPADIGSTGVMKYDATGAERLPVGESGIATINSIIDGQTRSFSWVVGRDS